ncbi:Zinc carboxypeptidase A 1 [Frankliniella fusca]|uniref:Zinc carboxypeptidase A 1 n=1 Tax=Frankliniella fusca TaxID=407009 RepID=A0AAE1LV47_9NEOP|nr:Zinc carboxypeptidase A 1 [Frankliniella fusca]
MLLRAGFLVGILATVATAALSHTDSEQLDGRALLQATPRTGAQRLALHEYLQSKPMLDVWFETQVDGLPVEVSVPADQRQELARFLASQGIEHRVAISDLHGFVNNQTLHASTRAIEADDEPLNWKNYFPLEKIYEWMDELEKKNPDTVRVRSIGKSYEGRETRALVINPDSGLPVVMVEAGIHAREWIAHAAATYFIDRILGSDKNDIVRRFEWHVFPCVNPDGYVYTWKNNRSWRKTRSPQWLIFKGVDPNRNWPYHWKDEGTNTVVYSEHYAGPAAASEPETRNLMAYVDALAPRMRLYLALHAYGQMLMYPWSYTKATTKRDTEMDEIAKKAVEAIKKKSGTEYLHGSIANTIYTATGSTIDYVYSKCVPYAYVFEMRPKFSSADTGEDAGNHGTQGFILPEEQIEDTAAEVWAGTLVLVQAALGSPSGNNPRTCDL